MGGLHGERNSFDFATDAEIEIRYDRSGCADYGDHWTIKEAFTPEVHKTKRGSASGEEIRIQDSHNMER